MRLPPMIITERMEAMPLPRKSKKRVMVPVSDTTGAGDAFFAGVAAGLTYGKSLQEACAIGTRLATSVICSLENTCPIFRPAEFGITI